jgi:hypothetical protein
LRLEIYSQRATEARNTFLSAEIINLALAMTSIYSKAQNTGKLHLYAKMAMVVLRMLTQKTGLMPIAIIREISSLYIIGKGYPDRDFMIFIINSKRTLGIF